MLPKRSSAELLVARIAAEAMPPAQREGARERESAELSAETHVGSKPERACSPDSLIVQKRARRHAVASIDAALVARSPMSEFGRRQIRLDQAHDAVDGGDGREGDQEPSYPAGRSQHEVP